MIRDLIAQLCLVEAISHFSISLIVVWISLSLPQKLEDVSEKSFGRKIFTFMKV